MLKFLSLGAGRQSSALYVKGVEGELAIDYAIFADTGFEPMGVYTNLKKLKKYGGHKVPIITVARGNIREDTLNSIDTGDRCSSMPLFTKGKDGKKEGMLFRQCTKDYKIMPVRRKAKEIMKENGDKSLIMYLGMSIDEWMRAKKSPVKFVEHRFPLIEWKWTADMCSDYLAAKGFTPVKSACICCPFRGHDSWVKMMEEDPRSFKEAVEFDKKIRKFPQLDNETYLHRSCLPLEDAVKKEPDMFGGDYFEEECDGFCGS